MTATVHNSILNSPYCKLSATGSSTPVNGLTLVLEAKGYEDE